MAHSEAGTPAPDAAAGPLDATQRPQSESPTHAAGATPSSPPSPPALAAGAMLGPYRLVEKLGEGGMGAVFKAQHEHLDMTVAVKVLPSHFTAHTDAVARFKREMKAVGKLKHPHIVQAHDAGEIHGTYYLAMEYVNGSDLAQLVKDRGPLSVGNACKAIRQAALALAAAHGAGLVHRDIKPSNLLLSKGGQIKLLDLGLARLADEAGQTHGLTSAGQMFGTPDYMAPEQWDDAHGVDGRCDLYALGCTLFFLLTGRAPFSNYGSVTQKLKAHGTLPPPDLQAAVNSVRVSLSAGPADASQKTVAISQPRAIPEPLIAIYEKLLAKRPEDRISSAGELVTALDEVLSSAKTQPLLQANVVPNPASPETSRDQSCPVRSRRRRLPGISRGALVALIGAAAMLAGIVIVIRKRDGTTVKIPVEKGDQVEIVTDTPPASPISKGAGEAPVVPPAEAGATSGYALEFDGKSSYVEIPTLTFDELLKANPHQPVTLEAVVSARSRMATTERRYIVAKNPVYLAQVGKNRDSNLWQFGASHVPAIGATIATPGRFQMNQPVHLAGVYDGKSLRFYLDGKLAGNPIWRSPPDGSVVDASDEQVSLSSPVTRTPATLGGARVDRGAFGRFFHGRIDEVRISKVARYAQDFTIPARLQPDAETLALYHFDEGQGAVLIDSSGHNHHGRIIDARWVPDLLRGGTIETRPDFVQERAVTE